MSLLSSKKEKCEELQAEFVYKGFKAAPTSILYVNSGGYENDTTLIVGTLVGTVELYTCFRSLNYPIVVYENKHNSQCNQLILQSVENREIALFAQFRGDEIAHLSIKKNNNDIIEVKKLRNIPISYMGFAKVIYDNSTSRLICPSKDVKNEGLSIYYENGGEKIISLSPDYLLELYSKNGNVSEDITTETAFRGSISGLHFLNEYEDGLRMNRILFAYEDCTFVVFDITMKKVLSVYKPPQKYNQLIDFAVTKSCQEDGKDKWTIGVSIISRVFELIYMDHTLTLTKKIKTTGRTDTNCSHLKFNSVGDKLICGYSSGKIEIFSVPDYTIESVINVHEYPIYSMITSSIDYYTGFLSNIDTVFAGDESGMLTQTKLISSVDELIVKSFKL